MQPVSRSKHEINAKKIAELCTEWLRIPERPPFSCLVSNDAQKLDSGVSTMINDWIRHCVENCDEQSGDGTFPKRLLYVQSSLESGKISLIDTHKLPKEKYAALSHRWGTPELQPPLKATQESLSSMASGIPLEDLPKTYRDAVTVCCSLDIPYLWIDSLCITQDSKEEWESESQKVGWLYKKAFITIIPSAARSCHDGFLQRPNKAFVEVNFQSSLVPKMKGSYFIHEPDFTKGSDASLFYQDTAETNWGTRGWTFNERMFATRRIYFGAKAMHWSCKNFYASEFSHHFEEAQEYNLDSLLEDHEEEAEDNPFSIWHSQFLEYSCREFTFPDDRLPAISPLAEIVGAKTGSTYLAGIWKSDLVNELLWGASKFLGPIVLPGSDAYVAPSWSWLARAANAEIAHTCGPHIELFIEILDASTTKEGINPFGRVRNGYIKIRGKACALPGGASYEATNGEETEYKQIWSNNSYVAECSLDGISFDSVDEASSPKFKVDTSNPQNFVLLPIRKGLCLKQAFMSHGDWAEIAEEQADQTVSGLVLVPSGHNEKQYCRVGIFESPPLGVGGISFFSGCQEQEVTLI